MSRGASDESAGSVAGRRWLVVAVLVALTGAALGLRLSGRGFLLPALVEPDGGALPAELARLERGGAEPTREVAAWREPSLVAQCARLVPSTRATTKNGEPPSIDAALEASADLRVRSRTAVACLSALTVPAAFLVARFFLSSGWSLVAAAFVATSFLQQWFAAESRPDAAATTFFTLAVLGALCVRRYGTLAAYVFAGVALGLAVGALESGVALLLPLAVAILTSVRGGRSRWFGLAALAVAVLVARPFYSTETPSGGWARMASIVGFDRATHELRFAGHELPLESLDFGGARVVADTAWSHEPTLMVLGGLALAALLVRMLSRPGAPGIEHGRDVAVVFAYVGPCLLAASAYSRVQARALIPLVPYFAILAAWGLSVLAELALARPRARRFAVALVLAPLALNAAFATSLARVRAAPDTIARAAAWFRAPQHFDREHERLAVLPPIDFPLPQTDKALAISARGVPIGEFPWLDYQRGADPATKPIERFHVEWLALATPEQRDAIAADPERFVDALDVDYVVVHALRMVRRHPAFAAVRGALLARAQLVERFSPDDGGSAGEIPLDMDEPAPDDPVNRAWRVLFADSTGPVMEIYRLPRRIDAR
ncbi:MAG: glycosyltransferase family 39 protein [Planctomycetes bacterium]|nr:glycosyltransferase family 39 protein [Planctomycetota bacterium]